MQQWARQYGDPFGVQALNGNVVLTGRPDLIRQVFSHGSADYDTFGTKAAEPILGSGSMLMLSGDAHRRERKLVMPMFHGDRMRAYANIMQQAAVESMQNQTRGTGFEMIDVTTQISLRVIVRAIFGGEDTKSIKTMMELAADTVRRTSPILLFSSHTQRHFLGISPWDRFLRARAALHEALDNEMKRRRTEPADREDILTMLLDAKYEDGQAIDPSHARDELATFLFAGHETSAIAMAWAIYHLLANPEKLVKLRSELSALPNGTAEQIAQLPYLRAVVQETLRLNPIITEVLRVIKKPMEIAGYRLPVGTAIAPAAILAHYNDQTFPEPDSFEPERFLQRSYSSAEYFPYGGGHRRCAGAAFASYEMAIVLGTILSRHELELLESKPVVPRRRNITMGPSTGVRVRLV